jgi:AcrR family transcriptional regulator
MSREPGVVPPVRARPAPAGGPQGGRTLAVQGDGTKQTAESSPKPPVRPATTGRTPDGSRAAESARQRPSHGGGIPARQRGLGAQGRETVRRLLEAGLAEFEETGLQATRVEDIVRRANTSHGTFYLYFANKDDLFRTLLRDALHDMAIITEEFPVVTSNEAGRAALLKWVQRFGDAYAAHATVLRILSQAEIVNEEAFSEGLQLLFRLAESITQGMTVADKAHGNTPPVPHAELTAVACLMMLERINYLISAQEVQLPKDEMNERVAAIFYAAFRSS